LVKSTLPYLPRGKQANEPWKKTIRKTRASSSNPSLCRNNHCQVLE